MEYLRILGTENTARGQAPGHEGGGRTHTPWAPPCLVGPRWPPPLIPAPTHSIFSPKKFPSSSSTSSISAAIFDLLAQSSIHKTALGDCCLVCDSSIDPISFCSSALFIANFSCLGDPVLELACQIYVVKSSFNA